MLFDQLRELTTGVTRHLPRRGFFRENWRRANRTFLRLGANPITEFRTKSGILLKVDLQSKYQVDAYYTGVYEPESVNAVLAFYDGEGAFLDVGANIGFYTAIVADEIRKRNGAGKVICFEPFPDNVSWLRANVANNSLDAYVRILTYGLSDQPQTLALVLREDFREGAKTGNASIAISDTMDAGFAKVDVQLDTLDNAWQSLGREYPRIDFVKVDIEGHEDSFFQGARQTFAAHRPAAMMEVNKTYFRAKGVDIDRTLRPYLPENYRIFRLDKKVGWLEVPDFASCADFENVFLVPAERLSNPRYREVLSKGSRV